LWKVQFQKRGGLRHRVECRGTRTEKLPILCGRTKSAVTEWRFIRLKENPFTEIETTPETQFLFLRQYENSSEFFQAVLYAVCRGNIGRQNGLIRHNAAAIFRQLPYPLLRTGTQFGFPFQESALPK